MTTELAKTNHNTEALNQARQLNYQYRKPIYCAIDNGNIIDLSIGEQQFKNLPVFVFDEVGQDKAKRQADQEVKDACSFKITGSNFTFTYNGEKYEGTYNRNKNSVKHFYRVPELNIKAETFSNLIKKI